jgi:multidrug efflux pump
VVVRLREAERTEADRIRSLYVTTSTGHRLPLATVADLRLIPAWPAIPRHDRRRSVTIAGYPQPGDLAIPALERALPAIRAIPLPPGTTLELDGEAKELAESQGEMGQIMGISLALIFLLLVMQFRSLAKAGAVMATVPLALIGAFSGLALFGASLGFMALLAIVSLAGVVVSHIIVLSDCIEDLRERGIELREALVRAGLARLRPVLVTVLATVFGLIPLALDGGDLWRPLAAVHIVGLIAGTGLTLVVLPVLYWILATRLRWIR